MRLRRLIRFLQQSFHGGTDLRGPIGKALQRVAEQHWQHADMLLVSDGRFPVDVELQGLAQRVQQQDDLQLQGLLIGRWSERGMASRCSSVERFVIQGSSADR